MNFSYILINGVHCEEGIIILLLLFESGIKLMIILFDIVIYVTI